MILRKIIFTAIFACVFGIFKSQTSSNWQPVLISMDGTNGYQGVEMYYSTATCGSDEVVLLKLVDTNSFALTAQWINLVVNTNEKEFFGKSQLVTMKIDASAESIGNCNKENPLVIKLKDYGVKASEFKTFIGSNFDISKK